MSNGIKGGAEGLIHAVREISKKMESKNLGILTIDATNAYNCIDRNKTLYVIYQRVPELYNTAFNVYGKPSYVTMDGEFIQVEQGALQGCPLSNTFFNLGISVLIDKLSEL